MAISTFILGGARSGKSSYAEKLAEESKKQVVFIATATAKDAEMQQRISIHRSHRPQEWITLEEPIYLENAIKNQTPDCCIIVDCLGFWLTNLLLENETVFAEEKQKFINILNTLDTEIILVSNEVGMGIVPSTSLARRFRDEIGFLHQEFGKICGQVIFMTAGFPIKLKSTP